MGVSREFRKKGQRVFYGKVFRRYKDVSSNVEE